MKTKTFSILFALVMVLSMSVGVFAADFSETWDENTVLTLFNDLDLYFPDMFADEDSAFLWNDSFKSFPSQFADKLEQKGITTDDVELESKAVVDMVTPGLTPTLTGNYDECGDGLIFFDVTLTRAARNAVPNNIYYGDEFSVYLRDIDAVITRGATVLPAEIIKCNPINGEDCGRVTFRRQGNGNYVGHLKGYAWSPSIMQQQNPTAPYNLQLTISYSTYMTMLWPVDNTQGIGLDTFGASPLPAIVVNGNLTPKKNYCQPSLDLYNAFGYTDDNGVPVYARGKYDENTGEARLQYVVRNLQPNTNPRTRRANYVIPAEVVTRHQNNDGTWGWNRITDYTCKYTIYNVANAAPRTDYCKFGQGINLPEHSMIRFDVTIDHLPGNVLRTYPDGQDIPFAMRIGGAFINVVAQVPFPDGFAFGRFEAVDFPCPPISRMEVMDPLKPFMTFFPLVEDNPIKPSGAYGVYEGGLWGMYQKCGKLAYVAVRLRNNGVKDEIVNLDHTAVAINGGTPMKFTWAMSTVFPEKGSKIRLEPGEDVILFGRAKVTDIPSQMNADTAMTGAVNFTDFGFYITGKVYSDHNNTRCVAAPK
jgi:hypothetical protein